MSAGLFASAHAQAQSPGVGFDELQQAMLLESVAGDYDAAILAYERLVRSRAATGAIRAQALYRLGSARYAIGDRDGAREALLKGIKTGECGAPCHTLHGQIQMETESIRKIPVRWTFEDGEYRIFHPWQFDHKGSIRVQTAKESSDPALIWETTVDVQSGDQLEIGFRDPQPAPSRVAFMMQAEGRDGAIRIEVVDIYGRRYLPNPTVFRISTTVAKSVVVHLDKLTPINDSDPPFDIREISSLIIKDVSARNGTLPGLNLLYLDDFTVQ